VPNIDYNTIVDPSRETIVPIKPVEKILDRSLDLSKVHSWVERNIDLKRDTVTVKETNENGLVWMAISQIDPVDKFQTQLKYEKGGSLLVVYRREENDGKWTDWNITEEVRRVKLPDGTLAYASIGERGKDGETIFTLDPSHTQETATYINGLLTYAFDGRNNVEVHPARVEEKQEVA